MKLHMTKVQGEERVGILKKVPIWEIKAWLELNEEERALLTKNPDVGTIKMIPYEYKGLDLSPSIRAFTDPKHAKDGGHRFVAYSSGQMMEMENQLNEQAKKLKGHLLSLNGAAGSSVTEI
jgi:hypothetical protein